MKTELLPGARCLLVLPECWEDFLNFVVVNSRGQDGRYTVIHSDGFVSGEERFRLMKLWDGPASPPDPKPDFSTNSAMGFA